MLLFFFLFFFVFSITQIIEITLTTITITTIIQSVGFYHYYDIRLTRCMGKIHGAQCSSLRPGWGQRKRSTVEYGKKCLCHLCQTCVYIHIYIYIYIYIYIPVQIHTHILSILYIYACVCACMLVRVLILVCVFPTGTNNECAIHWSTRINRFVWHISILEFDPHWLSNFCFGIEVVEYFISIPEISVSASQRAKISHADSWAKVWLTPLEWVAQHNLVFFYSALWYNWYQYCK